MCVCVCVVTDFEPADYSLVFLLYHELNLF